VTIKILKPQFVKLACDPKLYIYIKHYNGTSIWMTVEQPDRILAMKGGLFSIEHLKRFDCGYTELIWH